MTIKAIIETERLFLREMTEADKESLAKIISDEETMKYYPKPYDEKGVERWLNWSLENYSTYGFGLWAVCLKETGVMIGDCGITMQNIHGKTRPEIGYHFNKRYWRQGFAKEAAAAVRDWAFENTAFPALFSYCTYDNVSSYKTAESIGMHFAEEYQDKANEILHVSVITREEWKKTHCFLFASHPVFPTPNICRTAEFYHEKLGFRRVDYLDAQEKHICLYRDGVEFILTESKGQRVIPNHELYGYGGDAYVIVRNQQMLQEEYEAKGVAIIKRLQKTDYHNQEFAIEDIDGRWIYFGIKED